MADLLGLLVEAVVNLIVWDDRMRHDLRERHPWMFAFIGGVIVVAIALLAIYLFATVRSKG